MNVYAFVFQPELDLADQHVAAPSVGIALRLLERADPDTALKVRSIRFICTLDHLCQTTPGVSQ